MSLSVGNRNIHLLRTDLPAKCCPQELGTEASANIVAVIPLTRGGTVTGVFDGCNRMVTYGRFLDGFVSGPGMMVAQTALQLAGGVGSGSVTRPVPVDRSGDHVQRFGQVIQLHADAVTRYKELHASVWPEVLGMIKACHLTNYTIFLREPENLLFAYFEYVGEDYAADMARMAADPVTQKWWEIARPLQEPLPTRADGDWWAETQEVFHLD